MLLSVSELKKMLKVKTGIDPENQSLIYVSKYMDDKKTLGDYDGLGNGAQIFLVMCLPGGINFVNQT